MDGMILAAGRGTRLRPLTDLTPKALLDVGPTSLLERTVGRLARAGCDRIVINVHHLAERIEARVRERGETRDSTLVWHSAVIVFSREPDGPLETGGGLKRAAERGLFRGDRTILLHNVDVISTVDLAALARENEVRGALATLAVNRREASRYLVFDDRGLCGRVEPANRREEWAREPGEEAWLAGFTGLQAVSPVILGELDPAPVFPIVDTYLRLAASGHRILPWDVSEATWMDVGTPERLAAARSFVAGRTP